MRRFVASAQWDTKSLKARAILQETILDVLQKMFPSTSEEVRKQVNAIQFIDVLKQLLAFIVLIRDEKTIQREILARSQETYHL